MEEIEFDRLLKAARISLSEEERNRISSDIKDILLFFDKIDGFSSSQDRAFHPVEIAEKMRDDISTGGRGHFLNNADLYRFFVIGPKV